MRTIPGYTTTEVLLAESEALLLRATRGQQRVLLRVPASELASAEEVARLHYDYEVSRGLQFSGVARAFAFERHGRTAAVVLEDTGARPLASMLGGRALALEHALRIALRVAEVLGELHHRRIVHLRIEPANILVHADTLDIEICHFEDSAPLTGGTAATSARYGVTANATYISPERTGRMNRSVDHRSDFYSLGVTLYEMLIGRAPFQEADLLALVYSHLALEPSAPHELAPSIPEAVSRLVMKLLAKNAEERYQSAFGLTADLTECLRQLGAHGTIGPLVLGSDDAPAIFALPHRLYGRDEEKARLLSAFERVGAGHKVLCLVSGSSGVGKTALVQEVHKPIVRLHGLYGAGKFDQLHAVPYTGLIQAFQQVLGDILCMSEPDIARWRARFLSGCGELARVVADVLPEFELVTGPLAAVPPLGAVEAQARFNVAFRHFVAALVGPTTPLILFIDDLQWSDPASLEMLERLLTDEELRYLFVIGGYRSNEVDSAHPLKALIKRVEGPALSIEDIALIPLAQPDVALMVGDALGRGDGELISELTELVYKVTEGSPFFIGQFLRSLWARELLTFDPARGRWSFSLAEIQSSGIPESVGGLVASRIARLSPSTQGVLQLAACIGHTFELQTLAVLCEQPLADTAEQLWQAVSEGFVLPLDDGYKYARARSPRAEPARLKFLHDRVQEAAYAPYADGARSAAIHLRVGRLLLANTLGEEQDTRIFDIVDQLNLGQAQITEAAERVQLARLNLRAGERAKASGAADAAFGYFNAGLSLLGVPSGPEQRALLFSLGRERAECAYLRGDHAEAEAEFVRLLSASPSREATAQIQELRSNLHIANMNFPQAVEVLLDALRAYGIDLPGPAGVPAAIQAEMQALQGALAGRAIASLAELPAAEDSEDRARLHLLSRATSASFGGDPLIFVLLATRSTRASVELGCAPGSSFGFIAYSMVLAASGDYASTYEFGTVALAVSARLDGAQWQAVVGTTANIFALPWRKPPRACVSAAEDASARALTAGDPMYASVARWNALTLELIGGAELGRVAERTVECSAFLRRYKQPATAALCATVDCLVQRLQKPELAAKLDEDYRALLGALSGYIPGLTLCATFGSGIALLLRDRESAVELIEIARPGIASLSAHPGCVELSFYRALVATWNYAEASPEEQAERRAVLTEERQKLTRWMEICPANFEHKAWLVAAEEARLYGRERDASALYDQAIDSAANNGFLQLEALGGELCARFHLAEGRRRTARAYLSEARSSYERWGAATKVAALDAEFEELFSEGATTGSHKAIQQTASTLDLLSVVQASQAISSEMVLSVLLQKLMKTLVENAGARRGLITVSGERELFAFIDVARGSSGALRDNAESFPFAQSIVRRVQRTRETLVYDDARNEAALSMDPHVARDRPRSILCMPILAHNKLVGVLYLENDVTRGAFTAQRCKVLELLSAQAAISIENAQLYDTLENRVRSRTQELADRNRELTEALARLNATQQQLVAHEKLASLGTLTAGVAHELKNPLNFVSNFAALSVELANELTCELKTQEQKVDDDAFQVMDETVTMLRNNVARIAEHGKRADDIINNMLKHARGASNAREPVDLNGLVAACIKLAAGGAKRQHTPPDVRESYDPTVAKVDAIPDDLRRVFINLLNNANDALESKSRAAGLGYQPIIQVTTRALGERIEVSVRDNGTGIPDDVIPKIYDPFFTTKSAGGGTGLGLSICHGIVQAHRGDLRVRSADGEFTEFIVSLPAQAEPQRTIDHSERAR